MKGESARRRPASLYVIRRMERSRGAALSIGCRLPSILMMLMLLASLPSSLPPSAGLILPAIALRAL